MFKRRPKQTTFLALMVVVILIAGIWWPSGNGKNVVHAESLTFNTDSFWEGYAYSKYDHLSPTNTVSHPDGLKIQSLKIVNYITHDVVQDYTSSAVGKTSYTLNQAISGLPQKVTSKKNTTTRGYYAWYRYAKGTNGNMWRANFNRIDDSYNEYGDYRLSKSDELDSYGMPAHPGTVDNNLSLTGALEQGFYTVSGQWVATDYISHDKLSGTAKVNPDIDIEGPPGEELSGQAKPSKIHNYTVDAVTDLSRIIVRYTQDFNYVEDGSFKTLPAYGAALMVYYSAFIVDLESYTYHYPYELQVEFGSSTSSPKPSPSATSTAIPSPTPTPTPTPEKETIVAKFQLEKTVVEFGQYNYAKPIGSSVTGLSGGTSCKLKEYVWMFSQNGNTATVTNNTVASAGGLPAWPSWLTTGTVTVGLKVVSTCGGSATASNQTYQIITPPSCTAGNNAPIFRAGFVHHGNQSAPKLLDLAFPGDWIDMQIINDTISEPNTPWDPDGDPYYFTWDWQKAIASDSWLKRYYEDYTPDKYADRYSFPLYMRLTEAELGTHSIDVYATDKCGNSNKTTASINVILPNPIPVITLPPKVVEGRPYSPDISGAQSYSPRGYEIVTYEWYGTKKAIYPTAGDYEIKLDVRDSAGLWSLSPAYATLKVIPDLPPIADAVLSSKVLKNTPMIIRDTSYSPDGDKIVKHADAIVCDTNNNGTLDDDAIAWVSPDSSGNMTYTPATLSNQCVLRIYVEEDWGKSDYKEFNFQVVNRQPEVQISVKGDMPQPPVVQTTQYSLADMVNDRTRYRAESLGTPNYHSEMYYNPDEDVLISPDRKNALYTLPTGGAFSIASTGYSTGPMSYCSAANYYRPMDTVLRFGRNHFYDFGRACGSIGSGSYGMFASTFDIRSGTVKLIRDDDYRYSYLIKVNPKKDLMWTRKFKAFGSCNYESCLDYDSWMRDDLYRLSDIAAGLTSPFWSSASQRWTGVAVDPDTKEYWVPANPPPSDWVASKKPPSDYRQVPWNFSDNGVKSTKMYTLPNSWDRAGNFYAFDCTSEQVPFSANDDGTMTYMPLYSCKLQKLKADGTVIWTSNAKTYTNRMPMGSGGYYTREYPILQIVYVSKDNKRIITTDGMYDNDNGNYIGQVLGKDFSSYMGIAAFSSCYYMGRDGGCKPWEFDNYGYAEMRDTFANAYGPYIYRHYYTYRTVSGDDWQDSYITWHDVVYNIDTGQETLHLVGPEKKDDYSKFNSFENIGAVTADGKLIMPEGDAESISGSSWPPAYKWTNNFKVYDMATGALLQETGKQDIGSPSCTNWGRTIGGWMRVALTSDGEGQLLWSNREAYESGFTCTATRRFTFSGTSTTPVLEGHGHIVDSWKDMRDGALMLSVKFAKSSYSNMLGAGVIFREQDHRNYYKAELAQEGVLLYKMVDGVKTILGKQMVVIQPDTYASLRVKLSGNRIVVSVDGVPLIDVNDTQFYSGAVGVFAHAPNVVLKSFKTEELMESSSTVDNVVLVDSVIQYSVNFTDPDNDPPIPDLAKWTYTNIQPEKFLDAGDGKSDTIATNSYNGVERTTTFPTIGKVGLYKISFTEPDDPAPEGMRYPNPTFAAFRQFADPDTKYVIVHRRPISRFTLWTQEDGTIGWNDTSYDPDRWLSSTRYSTESPAYASNRGIYGRTYKYETPSGEVVEGKLTWPTEAGMYTVYMAVMDEYGAWSEWYQQTIMGAPLPPNKPPIPDFDTPSVVYRDTWVQLTNRSTDPDGDPLTYSWQIMKPPFTQLLSTEVHPAFAFRDLGLGKDAVSNNWFIELTATDSKGQSASIIKRVSVINQRPTTAITGPSVVNIQSTVEYTSGSSDPDPDDRSSLSYFWKLTTPSGNESTWTSPSYPITFTEGGYHRLEHYVVDQLGARSNTATLSIFANNPPEVELTTPSGPDPDHPSVNIPPFRAEWTYQDKDHNEQTNYYFRIYEHGTDKMVYDAWGTGSQAYHDVPTGYLEAGKIYYAIVQAMDGYTWSNNSAPKYFVLNRPPVADFDWSPKPIWEGDYVRLFSTSWDPDGQPLTYHWTIQAPSGAIRNGENEQWEGRFGEPGAYQVTLEVSDGFASDSITKPVPVLPLTIAADVYHTPEWLEHHRSKGHRTELAPKEFYSGELMRLSMVSAPAPVKEAFAWLEAECADGEPILVEADLLAEPDEPLLFRGELYDEKLGSLTGKLPNGEYPVHFRLVYANGVEKRQDVPVRIIGSILQAVQVHRVQ